VHFPFPAFSQPVLAEGLREAFELGLTRAVGVCNYDAQQLETIFELLAKDGIPVASNQVGGLYAIGSERAFAGRPFNALL
jgi:diketogulonate reductase-like aldo/keto reductase